MERVTVNIKPYHVFIVFDKYFIYKVKSLYYSAITAAEYHILRELEGKYQAEVTPETEQLLEKYNVLSSQPLSQATEDEFNRALWEKALSRLHIATIELMIAQTCNMNCVYCYGDKGQYGQSGASLMSRETAFRAIDFLKRNTDAHPDRANSFIGISFFGGEPLMNFPLLRDCVEYAEKLFGQGKVTFGITTNLTLLTDEILDFFVAHKINPLISFDGGREYQSQHRKLLNGQDSYDTVVPLIQKTLAKLPACNGRATMFYGEDEDKIKQEFSRLGFQRYSVVPVSGSFHNGGERKDTPLWYAERATLLQNRVHKLLLAIQKKDEPEVRRLLAYSEVKGTLCYGAEHEKMNKTLMSCGVGRTMVAISTSGEIYPCHRFVGMEKYCLGHLQQQEKIARGVFARHRIVENSDCRACYLKYCCAGGCMHERSCDAEEGRGIDDIFQNHPEFCLLEKTKMKLNAYVHASLNSEDVLWLKQRKILFLEVGSA